MRLPHEYPSILHHACWLTPFSCVLAADTTHPSGTRNLLACLLHKEMDMNELDELYSLDTVRKYAWSSITGELSHARKAHLEAHIVGAKILDAGCGGGAYVDFLVGKGLEVTGVDKFDHFLQLAREKGYKGSYVQADITNLPFPDKSFDSAYSFDVLEHVDDRLAVQELARVTKRRLILVVPKEDNELEKFSLTLLHYKDCTHLRYYTEASLKELALTVDPSNITIYPELPVPFQDIIHYSTHFHGYRWSTTKLYQKLFKYLLEKASYRMVYTGLVAIVDL